MGCVWECVVGRVECVRQECVRRCVSWVALLLVVGRGSGGRHIEHSERSSLLLAALPVYPPLP